MAENFNREEAFFLENINLDRVFNTIEKTDYLFLYYIRSCAGRDERGRAYLSELSDVMKIEIPELSRTMENLQSKGYVLWQTDHEEGRTYVELTSKAVELMREEKKRMTGCYEQILDEIGPEEMERTVQTMRKITSILINYFGG